MGNSISLSLIVAWAILFGFVNTHQRHARNFGGSSQGYRLALSGSALLGTLVIFGLFAYYFAQVAWYWPFGLFIVGSLLGGILFGVFDAKIGQLPLSISAFVGWPVSALWVFYLIHGINRQ